jgi:hypothetical protein
MKKHNWQSSPEWPAKNLWRYTCIDCGVNVVGTTGPIVCNDRVMTLVGKDNYKKPADAHPVKCEPRDWSPDWPPKKR